MRATRSARFCGRSRTRSYLLSKGRMERHREICKFSRKTYTRQAGNMAEEAIFDTDLVAELPPQIVRLDLSRIDP